MGFKLTYRDGQDDDYDDGTKWEVDSGVLKMGREEGNWSVLVSPSHWATIEIREDSDDDDEDENNKKDESKKDDENGDRDDDS
jgi:hypothetical protein